MLREIHLHGALGKRYGRRFRLDVDSPAEAVRAMMAQFPGFRETIADGTWRVVRGEERLVRQGLALDEAGLRLRLGRARHLHFLPALKGRGGRGGGVGKIIIGVIMVVAAIYTGGAAAAAYGAAAGAAGTATTTAGYLAAGLGASTIGVAGFATAGTVGLLGLSMILGGVSALLSPQKKNDGPNDSRPSFVLTGPTNTGQQGLPVPLVYGQVRVGSVTAGAAIRNESYVAPPTGIINGKANGIDWAGSAGNSG